MTAATEKIVGVWCQGQMTCEDKQTTCENKYTNHSFKLPAGKQASDPFEIPFHILDPSLLLSAFSSRPLSVQHSQGGEAGNVVLVDIDAAIEDKLHALYADCIENKEVSRDGGELDLDARR